MSTLEQLPVKTPLSECNELLQELSTEIFSSAERKDSENKVSSVDFAIWERLGAFQRLIQQQFPEIPLQAILGDTSSEPFEGISVVMGGSYNKSEKPFINTWIEVTQEDQTLLLGVQKLADSSYELKTGVFQTEVVPEARQTLGFRKMPETEMLEEGILLGSGYQNKGGRYYRDRISYYVDSAEAYGIDFISIMCDPADLQPYCAVDLSHPRVKQMMELVNGDAVTRRERISLAREMRTMQITHGWQREFSLLPAEVINAYGLDESMESWERYLELRYADFKTELQKGTSFSELTVEEFKHNYTFLMFEHHANILKNRIYDRIDPSNKVYSSFYEVMTRITSVTKLGIPLKEEDFEPSGESIDRRHFDGDSLLTHTISERSLILASAEGLVGANGVGRVCTSQDRITNGGRGKVVVWRVQDILDAGYPLYRIYEDRDSEVLREIRSYALPLSLAVKIDSLDNVPDANNALGAQIHQPDQFAGVAYLNEIRASLEVLV